MLLNTTLIATVIQELDLLKGSLKNCPSVDLLYSVGPIPQDTIPEIVAGTFTQSI